MADLDELMRGLEEADEAEEAGEAEEAEEDSESDSAAQSEATMRKRLRRSLHSAKMHAGKLRKTMYQRSEQQCNNIVAVTESKEAKLSRHCRIQKGLAKTSTGRKSRQKSFAVQVKFRSRHRLGNGKGTRSVGRQTALTGAGMCELSFDQTRAHNTLARMFDVSPQVVQTR